jgi:hypothetical protein
METKEFINDTEALLGAAFDSTQKKAYFRRWSFGDEFDPDNFPYRFVEAKDRGVTLQFIHDPTDEDEERFAFCAAFFYAEGVEDHKAYRGPLPRGLEFIDSRDVVRTKLGKPAFSGPHLDRWDDTRQSLAVDYTGDGSAIDIVILSTPFDAS